MMIMGMDILSFVILVVMALVVGFGALIGMLRGLKKSVGSSVVIAISLLAAAIATAILFAPKEETIANISKLASDLIGNDVFGELGISAGDIIGYYVLMLLAPFGFTLFFFVARFVFGIIMRIFVKMIPLMNDLPKVANRLGGAGVGLANGFIVIVIAFMPLLGTMGLIGDFVNSAENMGEISLKNDSQIVVESDDVAQFESLSSEASDGMLDQSYNDPYNDSYNDSYNDPYNDSYNGSELNPEEIDIFAVNDGTVAKVIMFCGGDLLYDGISTTKYNGERVSLKTEMEVIIDVISNIAVFSEDIENFSGDQITALRNIADDFDRSPIVRDIGAAVVSEFGGSWNSLSGDAGTVLNPVMSEFFTAMATTTADTVSEDVDTIADFLDVLVQDGLFDAMDDPDAVFDKLGEGNIISHIVEVAEKHDRMTGMASEAKNISTRALVAVISVNEEGGADEESIKADIAEALNEYNNLATDEEKINAISDRLVTVLGEEGITISPAMAKDVAANVVKDIGGKAEVTAEDVDAILDKYA